MAGSAETESVEASGGGSGVRRPVPKATVAALLVLSSLTGGAEAIQQPETRGKGTSVVSVGCVAGADATVIAEAGPRYGLAPMVVIDCLGKHGDIDSRRDCPPGPLNGLVWFRVEIASGDLKLGVRGAPPSPEPVQPPDYLRSALAWSIDSLSEIAISITQCPPDPPQ